MKKNIFRVILFILFGYLIYSEITQKDRTKELFTSYDYNAKIIEFSQPHDSRDFHLVCDSCGHTLIYDIPPVWFCFEDLKVGDSIIKKAGEKELRMVRNHKSQIYPLILSDTVMWNDSCCLYEDYKNGHIIKFKPKNY